MKALFSVASLFMIVLFTGCLGSSKSSVAPNLAFVYTVGQGANTIQAFAQKSTGDLSPLSISTFGTVPRPVALALHPSKNFIYVANQTSNAVSGFNLDHATGVLTPIGTALPPTPVCASTSACSNPVGLGANSTGQFLFVLNQGAVAPATPAPATISIFSIDTTRGLMTPIAGSPFPFASLVAPNPQFLAVSPTAGLVYVSNGVSGTISGFAIGASGALSELAGSPFSAGANITGITIDSKGQFLYAADSGNNKIASFSIQSNGVLAPVAGSPFATDLGPVSIALDSTGTLLYCANQAGANVSAFKVSAGALTPVAGSPFSLVATGTPLPAFVTVDLNNKFLYVGNEGTKNISAFTINSDGALIPLPNSPFFATVGPQWILITQ